MVPLMQEYRKDYPSTPLYLRGDSGFASPDLYEAREDNGCKYAIRLKQNSTLVKLAANADEALYRATRQNRASVHPGRVPIVSFYEGKISPAIIV